MYFSLKRLEFLVLFLIFQNFHYQSCYGLRILGLFLFNSRSHFLMSERLLQNLANKGHQVDVYNHWPLEKPLPNYTDYSLSGTIPDITNNLTYEFVASVCGNPHLRTEEIFKNFLDPASHLLGLPIFQKLIHDPPQDPPYDLIIGEVALIPITAAFAHRLNIPIVDIWSNLLTPWLYKPYGVTVTPTILSSKPFIYKDPGTFFGKLYNYFVFHYARITYEYHYKKHDQLIEKYFGPGYPSINELQKEPALLLINHHNSLHGIMPFSPAVIPISGIHIEDKNSTLPKDLQQWLDESKHGFVYFSFGSMVRTETFPTAVIRAMYAAFESIAPVRVIWKITVPEELPPNMPKNVMTQKWFPQQGILKHKNVKAFITHGGLMGTLESVYFGVPMVVIPLFLDQYDNAINYEKKKIAIMLDVREIESKFNDTLHEILKNSVYKQNAEKVSREYRDSPLSPLDTAIYWVEYVARHGRDVLRSPIANMPWFQIQLLDIFAFLIAIALVLTYVIVKLFKLLLGLKKRNGQEKKVKKN